MRELEYAIREIDDVTFTNPISNVQMTIAQMYAATDTDALPVMKDGKIVSERYFNGMKAEDIHLLMSTSKSVLGSVAGIPVEQGRLDQNALVTHYLPELAGGTVLCTLIGMYVVIAEIYPTPIRSTGAGFALGVGRVGSMIGPMAGGWALAAGWSVPQAFVMAAMPVLLGAVLLQVIGRTPRGF